MNDVPGGLHVETLLVIYQVVAALLALVTMGGAWQARGRYGLWLWAGSFLAIWLSQLVRPLLEHRWGDAYAFSSGHVGGIVASALLLLGVRAFLGIPQRRMQVAAFAGTTAIVAVAGTAGGYPAWVSLTFTLLASAVLRAQALLPIWRAYRFERGFPIALTTLALGVSVVAYALRAISVIPAVAGSTINAYEANALWLVLFVALLIIQGLAILVLVNGSLQREILALAEFDPLTGMLNRRGLANRFSRIVRRASADAREAQEVTLAMIDIDHFKLINDHHGHATGDDVLTHLGRRLELHMRPADFAARLGGEEFALIWVGTCAQSGHALAERLRSSVEAEPFPTRTGQISATISVGVANMHSPDESLDTLLQRVDRALYQAKKSGRNRVMRATE